MHFLSQPSLRGHLLIEGTGSWEDGFCSASVVEALRSWQSRYLQNRGVAGPFSLAEVWGRDVGRRRKAGDLRLHCRSL